MLNFEDLGFLLCASMFVGLCYYFIIVRKRNKNLKLAREMIEDEEIERIIPAEGNQTDEGNETNLRQRDTRTSALSSKKEARRQAKKEAKKRQKQVKYL